MKYEYWFANIKGIGNQKKKKIRERLASAQELYYIEEAGLQELGVEEKDAQIIRKSIETWDLEQEYERMQQKKTQFYPFFHSVYPEKLNLLSKGNCADDVVGARECSPYGKELTKEFAKKLASVGVQIISGMAKGIDGAGQIGALEEGGDSYGVLGCGVDICYPREHIELYTELERRGGLLSEQPIGTKPLPQFFPARNRIISGMSDIVLVMEARERSGSLITADMALEQGKDIYALPGPINSQLSRGCNSLIKQGAGILLSPEEFLEELSFVCEEKMKKLEENKIALESPENLVYSCLDLYPKNLNELADITDIKIATLMNVLVSLELQGYVR